MKTISRFLVVICAFLTNVTSVSAQWTQANGPYGGHVTGLAVSGTNIYAATDRGSIFRSTDNGVSWTAVFTRSMNSTDLNVLAFSGTDLYVGTNFEGVYRSADSGKSWTAVNPGLTGTGVTHLALSGTMLYAGTQRDGVWRRPLSEMVTSVEGTPSNVPNEFLLGQNYPNPFNPSTTISFSIPSRSFVLLKVFDVLGREVSTVVSEELPAGNYSRPWSASGLPSGMYFHRLQAGSFSATRKMNVVR